MHYQATEENMFYSFWRSFRECKVSRIRRTRMETADGQFVEDGEDIVFYKNASGIAQRVPVEEGGNVSDSGVDVSEAK